MGEFWSYANALLREKLRKSFQFHLELPPKFRINSIGIFSNILFVSMWNPSRGDESWRDIKKTLIRKYNYLHSNELETKPPCTKCNISNPIYKIELEIILFYIKNCIPFDKLLEQFLHTFDNIFNKEEGSRCRSTQIVHLNI